MPTGQGANQALVRGDKCYIVNSLSNAVQVIDTKTLAILGEISTGAGTNPEDMDFIDDNTAAVSCYLTNEVVIENLDFAKPQSERVIARIPMPSSDQLPHDPGKSTKAGPGGIAVIGDKCYAVCANLSNVHVAGGPGILVEIDIPSRTIVSTTAASGRDTIGLLYSGRFPERLDNHICRRLFTYEGFVGAGMVESYDLTAGKIFQSVKVDGLPFDGAVGPDEFCS